MKRKNFTPSEIEFILNHYSHDSIQSIAAALGRSTGSIEVKIYRLRMNGKIKNDSQYRMYTPSELEYIKKNYGRLKPKEIAVELGRTQRAIELTIVRLKAKEYRQYEGA
jgi:biotin operon repressor